MMASWTAGRTWAIFMFSRVGLTRFVSSTTKSCAVRIDPDSRAGEASVAVAVDGEIVAAGAAFSGDDPAKCARIFRERLRRSKFRNGGALHDAIVRVDAAVQSIWQNAARSGEVLNTPACPETPPMA